MSEIKNQIDIQELFPPVDNICGKDLKISKNYSGIVLNNEAINKLSIVKDSKNISNALPNGFGLSTWGTDNKGYSEIEYDKNFKKLVGIMSIFSGRTIYDGKGGNHKVYKYIESDYLRGKPFFETKEVTFSGENILILTTENILYEGNTKNYLNIGLSTLKLKGKVNSDIFSSKQNINGFNISEKNKTITISEEGETISTIHGNTYDVIDEENKLIYVVDNNILETIKISEDGKSYSVTGEKVDLNELGDVKDIRFDNNKNFLAVIANNKETGNNNLFILNRDGKEVLRCIENIDSIINFDSTLNDIHCLDTEGNLATINTNFNNFPEGFDFNGVSDEVKNNIAKIESALGSGIHISGKGKNAAKHEHQNILDRITREDIILEEKTVTINSLIEEMSSSDDHLELLHIISELKAREEISQIPGLLNPLEIRIQEKYATIKLQDFYERIDAIEKDLDEDNTNLSVLISYKGEIENLIKNRGEINTPLNQKDKKAHRLLNEVEIKIKEIKESAEDDILAEIENLMEVISDQLENTFYLKHVNFIYDSSEYEEIVGLINLLNIEEKALRRRKLNSLIQKRRNIIETEEKEKERVRQDEIISEKKSIEIKIEELKKLISQMTEKADILAFMKNGFTEEIKSDIEKLPEEIAAPLNEYLNEVFNSQISSSILSENLFSTEGSKVDLGKGVLVSKFSPTKIERISWKVSARRTNGELDIYFENNLGGKIEPGNTKLFRKHMPLAVSKQDFIELNDVLKNWEKTYKEEFFQSLKEYKEAQRKLEEDNSEKNNQYYEEKKDKFKEIKNKSYLARIFYKLPRNKINSRPRVPSLYSGTVIGPSTENFLQEFGALSEAQVSTQGKFSGITLIESDAGTGKNFKIDIFAHLTNREVFEMQGNRTAGKEDLLFDIELVDGNTIKTPSELIKAIQTPGAILVLDETNAYESSILKILNPLLDGRRYINHPQLGKIEVDKSVIIVGLMNPQHYLGVQRLSPEILSRALIMKDDYPQEYTSDNKVSWEEAFMITKEALNYEQDTFVGMWDIINNNKGSNHFNPVIVKFMKDLRKYIKLANKLREVYRNTQMDQAMGGEELNFIVSLREGGQIIQKYQLNGNDMNKAAKDVILPKIIENDERVLVQDMIDEIIQ